MASGPSVGEALACLNQLPRNGDWLEATTKRRGAGIAPGRWFKRDTLMAHIKAHVGEMHRTVERDVFRRFCGGWNSTGRAWQWLDNVNWDASADTTPVPRAAAGGGAMSAAESSIDCLHS